MPRINKPRVFLSHSKQDTAFIDKLFSDLRKCQIEPWLDTEEIRHGKPWLDAIFEDGIPTCDCVLLYFTENSIESKMVKKEMDAAILSQLHDSRIAFLPYVNEETNRQKLRADIQALQTPIWNISNYLDLLPCVVSEIWCSYHERTIATAIQAEKLRRVQTELELEKIRQITAKTVFDESEESDFGYIWDSFNNLIELNVEENVVKSTNVYGEETTEKLKLHQLHINKRYMLVNILDGSKNEYVFNNIEIFINNNIKSYLQKNALLSDNSNDIQATNIPNILDELLTYGLIDSQYIPPSDTQPTAIRFMMRFHSYRYVYTPKMYRLRYWLAYNNLLKTDFLLSTT